MLQLADDAVALDFDNAAAMRLLDWEDERNAALFGSTEPEFRFETADLPNRAWP